MKFCKGLFLASILLFFISVTNFVFANSSDYINVEYNQEKQSISLNGNLSSEVNSEVAIIVLPENNNIDELSVKELISMGLAVRQTTSDANGDFGIDITLPGIATSGVYTVSAICDSKKLTANFSHILDSELQGIINQINIGNQNEIKNIIVENKSLLNISDDDMQYIYDIARYLYSDRPNSGYVKKGFTDSVKLAVVMANLKENKSINVAEYIEQNSRILDINPSAVTGGAIDKLVEAIKTEDVGINSKTVFSRALFMAEYNSLSSYVGIDNLVKKYGVKCDLNTNSYNKLSQYYRSEVCKRIYNSSIVSFNQFEAAFNSAIEDISKIALKEEKDSPAGSGGGGGGGKSFPKSTVGSAAADVNMNISQSVNRYKDMNNHWAKMYVDVLSEKSIVNGFEDSTFRPDNSVTRAEFIKMLLCSIGIKPVNSICFDDCNRDDWFFGYVSAAKENGICEGDGNLFRPNENISRQEAATIIYRALNETGNGNITYSDKDEIADFAKDAVGFLSQKGLLSGFDGKFLPNDETKRSEAAAMIYKLLEYNGGINNATNFNS